MSSLPERAHHHPSSLACGSVTYFSCPSRSLAQCQSPASPPSRIFDIKLQTSASNLVRAQPLASPGNGLAPPSQSSLQFPRSLPSGILPQHPSILPQHPDGSRKPVGSSLSFVVLGFFSFSASIFIVSLRVLQGFDSSLSFAVLGFFSFSASIFIVSLRVSQGFGSSLSLAALGLASFGACIFLAGRFSLHAQFFLSSDPGAFPSSQPDMGRGVSSGGGQSSLGYLFGSGEPPKPVPAASKPPPQVQHAASSRSATGGGPSKPDENGVSHSVAAGVSLARNVNNYHRADGQNTGNFLTDRPSTKVHAAPGGGSSLGYLFGGGN